MKSSRAVLQTIIIASVTGLHGLSPGGHPTSWGDVTRPSEAHGAAEDNTPDLNICGPLALSSVAAHLGHAELHDRIFMQLPPDGRPRTLLDLSETASKLGLATRAVRWKQGKPLRFVCPAIIRLDPLSTAGIGHFVVILRSTGDSVQILDLPNSPTWVPEKKLWDLWDGIALHVACNRADLPGGNDRGWNVLLPALSIIVGLSSLSLLAWSRFRGDIEVGGRRVTRLLLLSAAVPALLATPTLARWGQYQASPIERALIDGSPSFKIITVDPQVLKDSGKTRVNARYVVHNRTNRSATIMKLSSSCGCALPRATGREIPAGGSVEIIVEVEPVRGQTKNFTIDVLFDRPENFHLELSGSIELSLGSAH